MHFFTHQKFIFIFFVAFYSVRSQFVENDLGMWLSLGCNLKLSDRQQINSMLRFRQYDNFSEFNSWYYDIGYQYKIHDKWRVALHYAFNPSLTNENYFRNLHQYYIRINYEEQINKYFSVNCRVILQHTSHLFIFEGFSDNGYRPFSRTDFRLRPGLSIRLNSRTELFLRNELMYVVNTFPAIWRRNRFQFGAEKKWKKEFRTSLYFTLQSVFNRRNSYPLNQYIFGFDAVYLFDLR
jgi:hypothetical protein